MDKYTEPHFTKSALITIDTQNDFTLENAPAQIPGTKEIIPNMVRLLELYRSNKLLIVHVVRLYLPDGSNVDTCRRLAIENGKFMAAPKTEGAELVSALKPSSSVRLNPHELLKGQLQQIGENEFVIYKSRWGAFYDTQLESFLTDKNVDTLVFSGCNFPNCPRTSIYEASERDFRIILAKDAISQLYARGEEEMLNIGVALFDTQELKNAFA